jgi:hypothetical protein
MTSDSVPLPAPSSSASGERPYWAEGVLGVLLCVLAFLLASTPARNSDLWLHLASGRALVQGQAPFGSDPFSSTTQGVYWVNATWLSDVGFYGLQRLGGGKALVVAKALLVTLIAALLVCFHLRGSSKTLLFFVGGAALTAAAPWLPLQPALLSLLGVVLTLYLLERPRLVEEPAAARARRQRWLLPPMFALWANLDGWFVLGPLLVGLYAVGEAVRVGRTSRPDSDRLWSEFRTLALLALAGGAACLCIPYHYRIFAWPIALGFSPAERAWRHDPLGRDLVVFAFGKRFRDSPIFTSPAAWTYYLLLAGGAISFLLSARTLRIGRLLAWLILAGLSVYQARLIPFFALSGAALLVLNVQEWRRTRPLSEAPRRWSLAAPKLGILAGLALVVLAWPGWLQPAPYRPRGWTMEPDESMVRLAHQLRLWHEQGRLPADRFALTFSPEAANYLTWFCPAEKGFVDSRWPLFAGVMDDYLAMRRCLVRKDADAERELTPLLDAHHLDRIVLYDPDRDRTDQAYRHLFLAANEWELLAIEGGAALFGRRAGTIPSADVFDYRRAAYRPTVEQRAPTPRPPQPSRWFDAFLPRGDDRSADRDEAALHLLSFDLQTETLAVQWVATQAAGLLGSGFLPEPATAATTLLMRLDWTLPPSPPEPLLLAVRAARRALAVHPDDAQAYLLLGEAYLRLARHTSEAQWQSRLPYFAVLRQVQLLTALEQAVSFRPDLDKAHALLAQLYYETEQWDRALDHLRARLRIADRAVKRGLPDPRSAAERRAALRADVSKMEELVEQAQKVYRANVADKADPSRVFDRAEAAVRYRLTRQALEMLLASYPAIFGKPGVEKQLDLMLKAGRAYELREWLNSEHEAQLGFSLYHWVQAQTAAACGDYADADAELEKGSEPLRGLPFLPKSIVPIRSVMAFTIAGAILEKRFREEALKPLEELADRLRQEADRRVMRGLLALECGDVEAARGHFRAALATWGNAEAAANGGGLDFPARSIAQQMLRQTSPRP